MTRYSIRTPQETHWRATTCHEVNCVHHLHGWQTIVDEATGLGQRQAHYIRREAGRHFTEDRNEAGLTVFIFPPGQKCFREHQARVGREEVFLKREQTGIFRMRPQDWVEDFGERQERLAERFRRGG